MKKIILSLAIIGSSFAASANNWNMPWNNNNNYNNGSNWSMPNMNWGNNGSGFNNGSNWNMPFNWGGGNNGNGSNWSMPNMNWGNNNGYNNGSNWNMPNMNWGNNNGYNNGSNWNMPFNWNNNSQPWSYGNNTQYYNGANIPNYTYVPRRLVMPRAPQVTAPIIPKKLTTATSPATPKVVISAPKIQKNTKATAHTATKIPMPSEVKGVILAPENKSKKATK